MRNFLTRILVCAVVTVGGAASLASGNDSASELPNGFGGLAQGSDGVMVRVPIDASGREDTNRAEIRFHPRAHASFDAKQATRPAELWSDSVDAGQATEVLGTNAPVGADGDTPTWGWYYWYNTGWAYPYYYSYYYPTFYYYNTYYYYSYYTYWNWYGYRYYWYNYYWY